MHSVYFPDMPVHSAAFLHVGSSVIASGKRKHFYTVDIEKQKASNITHIFGHPHEDDLSLLSVSPMSEYISFASPASGAVLVLDAKNQKLLFDLKMSSSGSGAA